MAETGTETSRAMLTIITAVFICTLLDDSRLEAPPPKEEQASYRRENNGWRREGRSNRGLLARSLASWRSTCRRPKRTARRRPRADAQLTQYLNRRPMVSMPPF